MEERASRTAFTPSRRTLSAHLAGAARMLIVAPRGRRASRPRTKTESPKRTRRMAQLRLTDLTKSYGSVHALRGVDLEVEDGEFFVLFGPSAAGKTTTLRIIAGLEKAGRRHADGRRGRSRARAGQAARHGDGLPELRPLPAPDDVSESRLSAQGDEAAPRRDRHPRARDGGASPHHPHARAQAGVAKRRRAAAARHRARHHPPAAALPLRRAAHQSRREAPPRHAGRIQAAPQGARHDDDLRHAGSA